MKATEIKPGTLVVLQPFDYANNPERFEPKTIGIFLGWRLGVLALVTELGYQEYWSSQWSIEIAENFFCVT